MVKPPRMAMEETIVCEVCEQDEAELIPGEAMRCSNCGNWIRYPVGKR